MTFSSSSSAPSELRWYYAVDDAHVGPVSASKFWQLAEEGVIQADTLVWCTGYTDWVPARTIDGLFKSRLTRSDDSAQRSVSSLAPTPMHPPAKIEPAGLDSGLLMQLAKSGILLGLLCIIFTKGCDAVDSANVERLAALRQISEQEFEQRWSSELRPLEERVEELGGIEYTSNADKRQLQEATESLRTAKLMQTNERQRMETEEWGPLRAQEMRAAAEHQSTQLFRRIAGLVGTTIVLMGLAIALYYAPSEQQLGIWIVLGVVIAAAYLGGPS